MPSSAFSPLQIIALLVIVGIAAWLIHRAGADLREQLKDRKQAGPRLSPEEVAAITSRGLATAEHLFVLSPKEQRMLRTASLAARPKNSWIRSQEPCGTASTFPSASRSPVTGCCSAT